MSTSFSSDDNKPHVTHVDVESESYSEDSSSEPKISQEHKDYLIARHGTFNLLPLPSMDDDDPLNWPNWDKNLQLGIIVFHGFLTVFYASGVVAAFARLAEELGQPLSKISYLTSSQIVVLGIAPLFWVPFTNRYGKRNILIFTCLMSTVFNLVCVFITSYGPMIAMRVLAAFFFSAGLAIGGIVVGETTFSHQRASRSGIWGLMVNLGTQAGPLFMGFVAQRQPSKYVFVVFTATNFALMLLYIFFGRESLYNYNDKSRNVTGRYALLMNFKPIIPERRVDVAAIFEPVKLFKTWKVTVAAVAYGVCFMFDNVATNVELPIVMGQKFQLGPQATGLQFISFMVGSLLGEQCGGWMSDRFMIWGKSRNKGKSFRLWLGYPGFITSIVGLIVYGFQIQKAVSWDITPLVGLAICSFGMQVVTTTMIAFSMDTRPLIQEDVALFLTAVRQTLGFIGPFFFPKMYDTLRFDGAYGLMAALIFIFAMVPVVYLHIVDSRDDKRS